MCMWILHVCEHRCPQRPEAGFGSSKAAVTDGFESPNMVLEPNCWAVSPALFFLFFNFVFTDVRVGSVFMCECCYPRSPKGIACTGVVVQGCKLVLGGSLGSLATALPLRLPPAVFSVAAGKLKIVCDLIFPFEQYWFSNFLCSKLFYKLGSRFYPFFHGYSSNTSSTVGLEQRLSDWECTALPWGPRVHSHSRVSQAAHVCLTPAPGSPVLLASKYPHRCAHTHTKTRN